MPSQTEDRTLSWYAPREPIVLILLSLTAAVSFIAVMALSSIYHSQQESRGDQWFRKGRVDLKTGQLERAVGDFHTALTYSRDNYQYRLSLAQALLALNRTDEAYAYLVNLWQREPENGTVDLELARIFADKGEVNQALRYYHNAIYAVWNDKSGAEQRAVRLELVAFLLHQNVKSQADAELISLSGDLPNEASLREHVGDLFMQVPDYERALSEYRQALKLDRHNPAAMAGAGRAAFELGRYPLAERYLQAAVESDATDSQSKDLLQMAKLVLSMDPYRLQFSSVQRNRMVLEAFKVAGERLKSCPLTPQTSTPNGSPPQQPLSTRWSELKPRMSERGLQRDPDLIDAAMDLVFDIERQTNDRCGTPKGEDQALFLIAKLHEAS